MHHSHIFLYVHAVPPVAGIQLPFWAAAAAAYVYYYIASTFA